MGSHESNILVQYLSNRRPEDGGLKTPKHVASLIDVSNKEIDLGTDLQLTVIEHYPSYCMNLSLMIHQISHAFQMLPIACRSFWFGMF
jgi:hypothetical protein